MTRLQWLNTCTLVLFLQAAHAEPDPRYDWRNPDPLRARRILREDLRLNEEQLSAACSSPRRPKLIIAGRVFCSSSEEEISLYTTQIKYFIESELHRRL